MAIVVQGQPNKYHPIYNPSWYYFSSNNNSLPGFQYIIEIFETGSSNLIGTLNGFPRPGDGWCEINISSLLKNKVSFNTPATGNLSVTAPNNFIRYDVKVKEKFANSWTYLDYEFRTTGPFEAFTILTTNPTSGPTNSDKHTYIVGDQININQADGGVSKPALQGLHTVVEVIDNQTIVIDVEWWQVGSGATIGGLTLYSDGRLTTTSVLETISDKCGFNAAFSFEDFRLYNQDNYIKTPLVKYLTTMPQTFTMAVTQKCWMNYLVSLTATPMSEAQAFYFINDEGDTISVALASFSSSSRLFKIQIGPEDIIGATQIGTAPLIKATTKWYTFQLRDINDEPMGELYKINISDTCNVNDNDYQLAFVDRLGTLNSFSFPYKINITETNEKSNYKKQFGGLVGTQYTYNVDTVRDKTFAVDLNKQLTLTSDYLNKDDARYFAELISSPMVYLVIDGIHQQVQILETNYDYKFNQKNRQYTVTVSLKENINI